MRTCRCITVIILLLIGIGTTWADVKLPAIFSDHMVLQRNAPIRVWGWAEAGEKVSVTLGQETETTTTNDQGQWQVTLAEHEYLVARYQLRRGLHRAAVTRIEYLMENFPKYPEMDSALCILGQAQRRLDETEEAEKTFARLRAEYPESQKCKKAKGSAS